MLIDTHCHIHSPEFFTSEEAETALAQAVQCGVTKFLLVGTSAEDSKKAVAFANKYPKHCWASVGIHPHEAAKLSNSEIADHLRVLKTLTQDPKVVAIGECGFDFYYNDKASSFEKQAVLLHGQLELAQEQKLPLSFHVREAFDEFWPVFEQFDDIRGVLHSFTDKSRQLERALKHKLKIGVNGIATFTTHIWQSDLFKDLSLTDFVLETDSPFLTPKPRRGMINTPENVIYITKYLAELRGESEEIIAKATTATATNLFNLT